MISQSCRIQRKPAHTLAAREALETTRRECRREEPLCSRGASDEMICSCEHNAQPPGPLSHGRRCERVMLMGSTQGESLNIAHYGAFYGAMVDGQTRGPSSYKSSYKLF